MPQNHQDLSDTGRWILGGICLVIWWLIHTQGVFDTRLAVCEQQVAQLTAKGK